MLIHWQSHQEYLNFLHETKVHLDSYQRTRLLLEFGPVREKLRLLDLDPVMEYLYTFYSPVGRPAKNQTQIIRSLILMVMLGFTSLTAWILKLKADSLLAVLTGCPRTPSRRWDLTLTSWTGSGHNQKPPSRPAGKTFSRKVKMESLLQSPVKERNFLINIPASRIRWLLMP